jgi:hypothetical protein
MPSTNTAAVYRRPYLSTASFAVALLLFLLPFFDIKCNNVSMVQLTGLDMAVGGRPNMSKDLQRMQNDLLPKGLNDEKGTAKSNTQGDSHLFVTALVALLLGVVGLVLSLVNKDRNQRPIMIVGIAGAVAMIAAWIEISAYVKANARTDAGDPTGNFPGMITVSASPTFWFILSLLGYAAAAFFSYQKTQVMGAGDTPPKEAPQLHIENPGDQSEFPAAPHDNRDLG